MVKEIENFEGYYAHDDGNIWSEKTKKFLKPREYNKYGHRQVRLSKNNKAYDMTVHGIIAKAFVPNPHNKPIVGHKDCNPRNNNAENLYWCTQEENNQHPITRKRRSEAAKGRIPYAAVKASSEKHSKQVYQYTLDGVLIAIWKSTKECGRNDYNSSMVSKCCNGGYFDKRRDKWINITQYNGYKWSYKPL